VEEKSSLPVRVDRSCGPYSSLTPARSNAYVESHILYVMAHKNNNMYNVFVVHRITVIILFNLVVSFGYLASKVVCNRKSSVLNTAKQDVCFTIKGYCNQCGLL